MTRLGASAASAALVGPGSAPRSVSSSGEPSAAPAEPAARASGKSCPEASTTSEALEKAVVATDAAVSYLSAPCRRTTRSEASGCQLGHHVVADHGGPAHHVHHRR
ncbi:MAG: hypothetical protein PGN11_08780 [Quadrisphaera sp.]